MKKILFITGTRADYGKLKSLMRVTNEYKKFNVHILVTGMHMLKEFGSTYVEIEKDGFPNIYKIKNHAIGDKMSNVLSNSINIFSHFFTKLKPDLIIIHGDRVEALAGAIAGALNNILVGHVEGGEISGTIDESIRHAISKFSHLHFVSNKSAKKRLIQLGENVNSIFTIGSPDLDFLLKPSSLNIHDVKFRYQIPFNDFGILLYHPVTTEFNKINEQTQILISSLLKSNLNFVVVYPNNDTGYKFIIKHYKALKRNNNFKLFPSIRFEYFIELLKNCNFIIGNSSAGIHEAPALGIPTINLGNRQSGRINCESVINIDYDEKEILNAINFFSKKTRFKPTNKFGTGNSYKLFLSSLKKDKLWKTSIQKKFIDFND